MKLPLKVTYVEEGRCSMGGQKAWTGTKYQLQYPDNNYVVPQHTWPICMTCAYRTDMASLRTCNITTLKEKQCVL